MNQQKNKVDIVTFICFLLIIAAMLTIGFYYHITTVNKCIADPLKFAVEKIREDRNADHVSGRMQYVVGGKPTSWDFGDEYQLFKE